MTHRLSFSLLLALMSVSGPVEAASFFHSSITDLSPPYLCKLKLKKATGVSIENIHTYQFSGICSIKIPIGNTWIYQNTWVNTVASWNAETNEGQETTTFDNNLGLVIAQLKCDDDPWISKSQCALVGYQNTTPFSNLGGIYNPRTGQVPPFEIMTGQYPPLARNQAILQEAVVLSVLAARAEADAAHTEFDQMFKSKISTGAVCDKALRQKKCRKHRRPQCPK